MLAARSTRVPLLASLRLALAETAISPRVGLGSSTFCVTQEMRASFEARPPHSIPRPRNPESVTLRDGLSPFPSPVVLYPTGASHQVLRSVLPGPSPSHRCEPE